MLRIAVCDDQTKDYELILEYINLWSKKEGTRVEVEYFSSGEEFIFYWPEEKIFDVTFLDVEMGTMSGMDVAKYIRERDEDMVIIFATGYNDYVFDGYDVRALNYLLKPINKERCFDCLDKSLKYIDNNEGKDYYILKSSKSYKKIKFDDIQYMIMFSHYIDIITQDETIKYKIKISVIEKELPYPLFVRCHRSYIVNLKYVDEILTEEIILQNGVKIPVSKKRWSNVNQAFIDYHLS